MSHLDDQSRQFGGQPGDRPSSFGKDDAMGLELQKRCEACDGQGATKPDGTIYIRCESCHGIGFILTEEGRNLLAFLSGDGAFEQPCEHCSGVGRSGSGKSFFYCDYCDARGRTLTAFGKRLISFIGEHLNVSLGTQ